MYSFYLCPISTVTSLYDLHLLKVKWFQNGIWGRRFPLRTNKNKSTWGIIVVKWNSIVHFLEEIEDTKKIDLWETPKLLTFFFQCAYPMHSRIFMRIFFLLFFHSFVWNKKHEGLRIYDCYLRNDYNP